jgi:hypothetical protein
MSAGSACIPRLWADRIVITLMPGVEWQFTNERVMAELAKSLKQVYAIISEGSRRKDKTAQTIIIRNVSDQFLSCPECGARNVLAPVVVDHITLPVLEIVGWRE